MGSPIVVTAVVTTARDESEHGSGRNCSSSRQHGRRRSTSSSAVPVVEWMWCQKWSRLMSHRGIVRLGQNPVGWLLIGFWFGHWHGRYYHQILGSSFPSYSSSSSIGSSSVSSSLPSLPAARILLRHGQYNTDTVVTTTTAAAMSTSWGSSWVPLPTNAQEVPLVVSHSNSSAKQFSTTNDFKLVGWQTIHVYYGMSQSTSSDSNGVPGSVHSIDDSQAQQLSSLSGQHRRRRRRQHHRRLGSATATATDHVDPNKRDPRHVNIIMNTAIEGGIDTTSQHQQSNKIKKNPQKSKHPWYSQAHQDEWIVQLFQKYHNSTSTSSNKYKNQFQGYYIDLAANDAKQYSNTYVLEHYYHWNGLCIEPNPMYWYNLSHYRPHCQLIGAVIGGSYTNQNDKNNANNTTTTGSVYFRYEAAEHGGIADQRFDNGKQWQRRSQLERTISLYDVLQTFHVPSIIDYLSLDVEGAEEWILQLFFQQNKNDNQKNKISHNTSITNSSSSTYSSFDYLIKVITAERLNADARTLLQQNGYEFITRLSSWGETLWVHESIKHELDFSFMNQ